MAEVSSAVATGRRMNGSEIFMAPPNKTNLSQRRKARKGKIYIELE
jgi:hypothetical protein